MSSQGVSDALLAEVERKSKLALAVEIQALRRRVAELEGENTRLRERERGSLPYGGGGK